MAKSTAAASADARILELAIDHIRRFGPDRFTVVALARELGMSHANVYRYFASKAGLLEAVTAQWLRPIETGLREIADSPDPARDKLERMLGGLHRAYCEKLESEPELFAVFADLFRTRGGLARKHRTRIHAEVRRVIDEGAASAAFAGEEQNRALSLIFDAAHRFIHPVCLMLDRDIPRDLIAARFDRIMEIVFSTLTK